MTRKAGSWECEAAAHRSCGQETAQTGGGSLALKPEGLSHLLKAPRPPQITTPSWGTSVQTQEPVGDISHLNNSSQTGKGQYKEKYGFYLGNDTVT